MPNSQPVYDAQWALEVVETYMKSCPRVSNFFQQFLGISNIHIAEILRRDNRKWERFKAICKNTEKYACSGSLLPIEEPLNGCEVDWLLYLNKKDVLSNETYKILLTRLKSRYKV